MTPNHPDYRDGVDPRNFEKSLYFPADLTDTRYMANDINPKEFTNYFDFIVAVEEAEDAADDFYYDEPDIDAMFEHDSAMESIGWGTDEDYGYFGGDEW